MLSDSNGDKHMFICTVSTDNVESSLFSSNEMCAHFSRSNTYTYKVQVQTWKLLWEITPIVCTNDTKDILQLHLITSIIDLHNLFIVLHKQVF